MIPLSLVDKNGEPKVYTHKCSEDRKGHRMSLEELDLFAKDIFQETVHTLTSESELQKGVIPGADFYQKGVGYDKDIVVRYYDEHRQDYNYLNLTKRNNDNGQPVFPIIILVWLWNTSKQKDNNDEPNPNDRPAGGDFFVKIFYRTLLPCLDENRTDADSSTVIAAIMDSWKQLDCSLLEKYLAYNVQYTSSEVFEVISSKDEYLYFFAGKYETLRKHNLAPEVELYRNMKTNEPAIYLHNGDIKAVLEFDIRDGMVRHMSIHPPQPFIKPEGSAPEIMGLYAFEYRVLPYLVDQCSKRQLHPLQISQKSFIVDFVEANCDKVAWNWDDFNSMARKIDDKVVLLFWFPEPDMAPLARFAAAIVAEDNLSYYTLEYDDYENKKTWYLCAQDVQAHHNLGQVNECKTMNDFITLLQTRILKTRTKSGNPTFSSKIRNLFKK